jgi:microcompartment protein CcmK/EutM
VRIAEVIGTVTLSRCHPTFDGASLRMVRVLTLDDLLGNTESDSEPLVVWDDLGTGIGHRIAISEGGEAAQPFRPLNKPVDAYNAAILDDIQIEPMDPQAKKKNTPKKNKLPTATKNGANNSPKNDTDNSPKNDTDNKTGQTRLF